MTVIQIILTLVGVGIGIFLGQLVTLPFLYPRPKYAIGAQVIVIQGKHEGVTGYIYSVIGRGYTIGGGPSLLWVPMKYVTSLT